MRFVLDEQELSDMVGGPGVLQVVRDPATLVAERILAVARDAVENDGAESIVLGCSCMTKLTPMLQEALPVPVVDPRRAGFLAAIAAVDEPSRGVEVIPDTWARITAAVDVWAEMGDSITSAWADDCGDVCATVA